MKTHDERYREIIETAEHLFFEQGYAGTSVQAIINKIGIAKGTFYHYFSSKEELLEVTTLEMSRRVIEQISFLVEKEGGSAVEKINRYNRLTSMWKADRLDAMLPYLRELYSPENVALRVKLNQKSVELGKEIYSRFIKQGVAEGIFHVFDPDRIGELLLHFKIALGDMIVSEFLELPGHPEHVDELIAQFELYEDSTERLLGAPKGSLQLYDKENIKEILIKIAGGNNEGN
jgi:AcrR family transcriptional regulator